MKSKAKELLFSCPVDTVKKEELLKNAMKDDIFDTAFGKSKMDTKKRNRTCTNGFYIGPNSYFDSLHSVENADGGT